jgi:hypothetical protein
MTGPGDPSFADMFQVLVLLAIPAAILLALRYVNRRGERTQRRSSRGPGDAEITTAIVCMDFRVPCPPSSSHECTARIPAPYQVADVEWHRALLVQSLSGIAVHDTRRSALRVDAYRTTDHTALDSKPVTIGYHGHMDSTCTGKKRR